jgi:hypothetical protein
MLLYRPTLGASVGTGRIAPDRYARGVNALCLARFFQPILQDFLGFNIIAMLFAVVADVGFGCLRQSTNVAPNLLILTL